MITIQTQSDGVLFNFQDSTRYLYGDGSILTPYNSLTLIADESNVLTFRKSASNDIFITAGYDELGYSSKEEAINDLKTKLFKATGGGTESGITSGDVQTMIDNSLEDYYDKDEVDAGFDEVDAALSGKADASDVTEEISAAVSGKADTTAVTAVENDVLVLQDALAGKANTAALTAHTADTSVHVSQQEKNAWNAKAEPYSAGTGIDITDNVISTTGGGVTVDPTLDSGSTNPVANSAITTAIDGKQDALVYYEENTEDGWAEIRVATDDGEGNTTDQHISIGGGFEMGNYQEYDDGEGNTGYTSTNIQFSNPEINMYAESEDNGETEATYLNITPTGVTINDEDVITESRLADYQPVLSAGTGIDITDNVISATGGGGATYSAGTNISIDTANTINCTLPISAGTGQNSLSIGNNGYGISQVSGNYAVSVNGGGYHPNTVRGNNSFAANMDNQAIGEGSFANGQICIANGKFSHAEGAGCTANTYSSHAEGCYVITNNNYEHSQGKYNVSNSGSTESGQTLFSVGNGTSNSARHNAFEIRQNGDIYITSGGTDIKLQDNLGGGGGGGSVTVDSTLDMNSSNPVENQAIAAPIEDIYNALDGSYNDGTQMVKLKRISQSDYDDLLNGIGVDYDTLYIITPDEENEGGNDWEE